MPPHPSLRAITLVSLVLGPLLLGSRAAGAQTVEGVVEEAPRRVLVRLVGEDGSPGPVQVTDPEGQFLMAVPSPGVYRVRVERMGFRAGTSVPVSVGAGERARVRVPLPEEPLELASAPLPTTACAPEPDGMDRLSLAWRSIRTAMEIGLWSQDRGELLLDAEVRRRQLEADARTVVRAEVPEERRGVSRLAPAVEPRDLLERGFIREDESGNVLYFQPSPEVLVDPGFVETHCLRLQGPEGGALMGVAFEPREGLETALPDVAGVIWISSVDGRPVLLEFAYRNVDPKVVPASAGGRTTFAELPDGSWVTAETWLRMPLLQVTATEGDQTWRVAGLREERARLLRVREGDNTWAVTPQTGELQGRVLASQGGEGAAGAQVSLVGTPYSARTDPDGAFRISNLLEGVYRVSASHPRFDQLPLGPGVSTVQVTPGSAAEVTITPPSAEDAALQLCAGPDASDGSVIVTGQIVDSLSSEPLVGLPLTVRFLDPRREGRPYHEARVASGAGGFYVYCDAPRGQTVRIRPALPGARVDDDLTFVALAPVERKDLVVRLSTEQAESGVFGVIRDAVSGRPVEAAEVWIQDTGRRVTTNSNGFYAIPGVEPGLYILEISHLGYADREVLVRVDGGQAYEVDVTLEVDAIPLEGITVTVVPSRLFGDMVDLQRRMELGFGDFVVRSELEIRGGTLASILQGRSGVRVVNGPGRAGERFLVLRESVDIVQAEQDPDVDFRRGDTPPIELRFCFPAVWVDGRRWSRPRSGGVGHDPVDFTQFVAMDIEAVEIYRGAGSVPGEFGGGDAACGAVVIWTRRGGRTIRGEMGGRPGTGTEGT
jgi:hypothetical protein